MANGREPPRVVAQSLKPYGIHVLPKFEYGHLYKFAVSLGLLMVALGLALPWLVLRESGSLLIPESELDALTPRARRVLLHKQGDQEWIAGNYRYASLGLVVTGLAVGSFGFLKWARRQSVADEIEDTQRDTAQVQLRRLTPSETSERLDQESAEVLAEESAPPGVEESGERQRRFAYVRKKIERVEQHVLGVLSAEFQSTHQVLPQVRMPTGAGTVPVDALLVAVSPHDTSYVVEIKFLQGAHPEAIVNRLGDAIGKLMFAAKSSAFLPGRPVAGIVILVMAEEPTAQQRSIVNGHVEHLRPVLPVPVGVIVTSESALEAAGRGWLRRSVAEAVTGRDADRSGPHPR